MSSSVCLSGQADILASPEKIPSHVFNIYLDKIAPAGDEQAGVKGGNSTQLLLFFLANPWLQDSNPFSTKPKRPYSPFWSSSAAQHLSYFSIDAPGGELWVRVSALGVPSVTFVKITWLLKPGWSYSSDEARASERLMISTSDSDWAEP